MPFNTGNPVPSNAGEDLDDNSRFFDEFAAGTSDSAVDRLGTSRKTIAGMEAEFNAAQTDREQRFSDFLAGSAYTGTGTNGDYEDYAAGITVTEYNQVIRDPNGEFWRLSGSTTLPYTTTGAGLPEGGAFVAVGDAVLRQALNSNTTTQGSDLIAHTGTSDTVTEALDKRTIFVGSVAELEGLSLAVGVNVYLAEDGRYGSGTVKSGTHAPDPYKGIFVDLSNGNYWERDIPGGVVYLSWFGPDTTGSTEQDDLLQSAVDLTPDYGTLSYEGIEGTILVDIPSGLALSAAVNVDRPMTVVGSSGATTKLKDFCSAWTSGDSGLTVYAVTSSDVTIKGLRVDANADNHYETDGSGNKYWETGPTGKRPSGGITVKCADGQANIKNVVIDGNYIYRPLGGIGVGGALGQTLALNDPSFIAGTLDHSLVDGAVIKNNVVERARGNDYILNAGVINSEVFGNNSVNSMYHPVRFYASTINCHAYDNHASVDYDYLAGGYNATDLWYWRTDNVADGGYLIIRSGYRMGSGLSSVIDCSMTKNTIRYANNAPTSAIIDRDSADAFSFQTSASAVKNILIEGNKSYRSPFGGLFGLALESSTDGKETEGVVFSGNKIFNCRRRQVLFQGNNFTVTDNYFEDCSESTLAGGIVRLKGQKIKYLRNTHKYNLSGSGNSNNVFEILSLTSQGETDLFVSDSTIEGYTGTYSTKSDSAVNVHGTDVGITPALLNGWANVAEPLTLFMDVSGKVSVVGDVNGSASTGDIIINLPAGYPAKGNKLGRAVGIQYADIGGTGSVGDVYPMRVSGALRMDTRGLGAERVGFTFTYQAEGANIL